MELEAFHPFRSPGAQQDYLSFYDRRAEAWPLASEARCVETSFGQTFVRISGPVDGPPLVLLPASVFHSLMWIPNIQAFSQKYRTYALDNIYDCGRSIYTRRLSTPAELVGWLEELFNALELGSRINLMGLSYGSWLAHQYTLQFPQRVRKIVLLAHPTIVSMNKGFLVRLLLAFVSARLFRRFVFWLFEDTARKDAHSRELVESIYADMQLAGKCFKPKAIINPTATRDAELSGLRTPALFLVGENEKTFSPHKAIQRLQRVAPQAQAEIIPGAGHDLNFAQAERVNQKVLAFLE